MGGVHGQAGEGARPYAGHAHAQPSKPTASTHLSLASSACAQCAAGPAKFGVDRQGGERRISASGHQCWPAVPGTLYLLHLSHGYLCSWPRGARKHVAGGCQFTSPAGPVLLSSSSQLTWWERRALAARKCGAQQWVCSWKHPSVKRHQPDSQPGPIAFNTPPPRPRQANGTQQHLCSMLVSVPFTVSITSTQVTIQVSIWPMGPCPSIQGAHASSALGGARPPPPLPPPLLKPSQRLLAESRRAGGGPGRPKVPGAHLAPSAKVFAQGGQGGLPAQSRQLSTCSLAQKWRGPDAAGFKEKMKSPWG